VLPTMFRRFTCSQGQVPQLTLWLTDAAPTIPHWNQGALAAFAWSHRVSSPFKNSEKRLNER
jgi:hypothetical protein